AAGTEPGDGVGQCDVGAGDGGGTGAAVGLQDVAVDGDGVLAQCGQIDAGAQRAADEATDLVGAATDLAAHRFTLGTFVGGGRQHRVLGGQPAQAGTAPPGGDALGDAGGAHDAGVAELDEHRARRVGGESAGEL